MRLELLGPQSVFFWGDYYTECGTHSAFAIHATSVLILHAMNADRKEIEWNGVKNAEYRGAPACPSRQMSLGQGSKMLSA